jgi:hypothetical protein
VETVTTYTPLADVGIASQEHVLTPIAIDWFDETMLAWKALGFDPSTVAGWTPSQARRGIVELERLTRSANATKAALISRLAAGRDTTATLVRETGMSRRVARELQGASKIVNDHPEALEMLSSGAVSTEHLAHLAHLKPEMVGELLEKASNTCADDYKKMVDQHRVGRESKSLSEEQHNSRSVKFFTKPNGCVGATIVLPPIEGTEFKTVIEDLCDQAWRTKHPERAATLGAHDDEPRERRLADAFIEFMKGDGTNSWRGGGKPSVVVVVDAQTLESHIVPNQPIPTQQAMDVLARADVYAAIKDSTKPAQLRFGRNKRVATPLQKLAMLVDSETCAVDGCTVSALNSDAHHIKWFEHGGNTDIDNFEWRCRGEQGHHPHIHENTG